jgi:hypothetical protein
MGFLIGGPDATAFGGFNTWACMRTPMGQITPGNQYDQPTVNEDFNHEWAAGFYFTNNEGGFLKNGFLLGSPFPTVPSNANKYYPIINIDQVPPPPGNACQVGFYSSMDVDFVLAGMIGRTVGGWSLNPSFTFSITAPMNTSVVNIAGTPADESGGTPINAISGMNITV